VDSIFLKEKTRVENQIIYVYWWNFGKKTIDYQGSYAGYLKKKDIKVRIRKTDGYRFTITTSSGKVVFDTVDCNYNHGLDEAIKIFFAMMGDKAELVTPYREYKMNWR
jgi:hypothetical protein